MFRALLKNHKSAKVVYFFSQYNLVFLFLHILLALSINKDENERERKKGIMRDIEREGEIERDVKGIEIERERKV